MEHTTQTNHTLKPNYALQAEMFGIQQCIVYHKHTKGTLNQQKISLLEQKETIDAPLLQQISAALKILVEAIQNFDEEQAVNIIANTSNNGSFLNTRHTPTFNVNPIEELKRLHEEKIALYERMLKEKDEMMAKLEKLIEGK